MIFKTFICVFGHNFFKKMLAHVHFGHKLRQISGNPDIDDTMNIVEGKRLHPLCEWFSIWLSLS